MSQSPNNLDTIPSGQSFTIRLAVNNLNTGNLNQLGVGLYLSAGYNDWPLFEWECDILADAAAWDRVNKLYVPSRYLPPGKGEECDALPLWETAGSELSGSCG